MGLTYTADTLEGGIGDCKMRPGQDVAELIFGTTITRGVIRGAQYIAGGFGANGCKDPDTLKLMHPEMPAGSCCTWTADCHDPNSCMYCNPCDGNSYSIVGGQKPHEMSDEGRYCTTSRACGKYKNGKFVSTSE